MSKAIFSYNADIAKNAYLNWRTTKEDTADNLFILGESFADAATLLMERVLADNKDKKADSVIFPVLYCIDQSIELYIKAILRVIETLEGGNVSNFPTHNIKELQNQMCAKIKKRDVKTKGLQAHLEPVSSYINELYQKISFVDEKGKTKVAIDFARYPIDTSGNPHFYVAESDNVVIDVEALSTRYEEIKNCLYGLYSLYKAELEERQSAN